MTNLFTVFRIPPDGWRKLVQGKIYVWCNNVCCSQFCLWIKTVSCHGNRNRHGTNLISNDTIGKPGPENIRGRCKPRATIFHGGRVIVNFVPKFVAIATGVGRGKILVTPSDSPGLKIEGGLVQTARNYLLRRPSYTALNSPLVVMQNFATFEWLLWQQGSLGGTFKWHC